MNLYITIPTYNRPTQIQKQVRDVLKQLRENVYLIVVDNCSDVPVETYFTADELSQFTIIRNRINIGRDQNQVRCLENVEDGWAWTLSDDDTILDNAIEIVMTTINEHPDYCYINFGNKKEAIVESFDDLVQYFSITGTFGISFFQSACVYNMTRLSNSLWWFNDFLSSQVGQICMVLKHMEKNAGEKCYFLKKGLIGDNPPGGWNPLALIINTSIIIDKYQYKRKELKGTLFKGLGDMYFTALSSMPLSFSEFCYYDSYLFNKLGLFNVLRYNFLSFSGHIARRLIPQSLFCIIKKKVSANYNRNIK